MTKRKSKILCNSSLLEYIDNYNDEGEMRKHYLTKKQRNYANNLVNSFLSPQRAQNYQGLLHLSKMRVVECLMNV